MFEVVLTPQGSLTPTPVNMADSLSPSQREKLGTLALAGKSIRSLALFFNCTRHTVRRWREEAEKPVPNWDDAPRSGRPAKLSNAAQRHARRSARTGHTVPQVAISVNKKRQEPVSTATVRRALVKGTHPLQWAPVNRGRRLSAVNKLNRFHFAQKHQSSQSGAWLYGDSKLLYLYQDGPSSVTYAWQDLKQQQERRPAGDPIVMHFYAIVGKGCKSKLVFTVPSAPLGSKRRKAKEAFASRHYIDVAQQLHSTIKTWGKDSKRHPVVMDRARQHTSKASKAAIEAMCMHLLDNFPAQSWDMNIIEIVWGVLDTKLRGMPARLPPTPDGWRRRINKAWDSIDQSTIDMLVGSVRDRMNQIVEKEGAWLSLKG